MGAGNDYPSERRVTNMDHKDFEIIQVSQPINSSFWGWPAGTVKPSTEKPTVKPVYGSFIRKLFKWPKHHEVTYYFEVKQ